MKLCRSRLTLRVVAVGIAAAFGLAGSTAGQAGSAGVSTPTAILSPEIQPDRRVTFRLLEPNAHQVSLELQSLPGPVPMEKGATGVWSVTVGPLAPHYYTYSFPADGLSLIDPSNPRAKISLTRQESILFLPGPDSLPWQTNDVPHGVIHHHFYHSRVAGDDRDFYVYTPPGYDPSGKKHYPVLYLLHGAGQTAESQTEPGAAPTILDNLLAQKKAVPMIVAMPLGYGYPITQVIPMLRGRSTSPQMMELNLAKFTQALLTEVMPQVEKDYLVLPGRADSAIAGVSMGGGEALYAGLNHLDRFSWVGAFEAAGIFNLDRQIPQLSGGDNSKIQLLWTACGEQDNVAGPFNKRLRVWLSARGIRFTKVEYEGTHSWEGADRSNLAEFVRLLFRPESRTQDAGR